jgi:hypothetical protein
VSAAAGAFWSYVHKDDDAESGRVVRLATDLAAQYEMITGEPIEIFVDQRSLQWGDEWRSRVDAALESMAFFVAVLTPRYFMSVECRRELQTFGRQAEQLGVKELVLPLLYCDVPALHAPEPGDDLLVLVRRFGWEDWRTLRFKDPSSEHYRIAVASLAQRLARAQLALEEPATLPATAVALTPAGLGDDEDDGDPLGTLDLMAIAEDSLPAWTATMSEIGVVIQDIGDLAAEGSAEIDVRDKAGGGFSARLAVARRLAHELEPRAVQIVNLANDFAAHLYRVDAGVRAMIEAAPAQAAESDEAREQVCAFFASLRNLIGVSREGVRSMRGMVDTFGSVEEVSRDMRPPLRMIRRAVTVMIDGFSVVQDWERLIDASDVDCIEPDAATRVPDR